MKLKKSDIATAVLLAVYIAVMFTVRPSICIVHGQSMEPTLHEGQILFSVKTSQIERMDIVIIKKYGEEEDKIIKRVIGIPGDTVQIHDGRVYVNGEIADDLQTDYAGILELPFTLFDGQYIVLGDNRDISHDSRSPLVGIIYEEQILRKIVTSK